jgi:hypothetical protein
MELQDQLVLQDILQAVVAEVHMLVLEQAQAAQVEEVMVVDHRDLQQQMQLPILVVVGVEVFIQVV